MGQKVTNDMGDVINYLCETGVVEVRHNVMGGIPVLVRTRFPAAQVFAELASGLTVAEIAADFDIDESLLVKLLDALGAYFGRHIHSVASPTSIDIARSSRPPVV